jgi:hypothetical protein
MFASQAAAGARQLTGVGINRSRCLAASNVAADAAGACSCWPAGWGFALVASVHMAPVGVIDSVTCFEVCLPICQLVSVGSSSPV